MVRLDARKQTIDNAALHCYKGTILICKFVDNELTDKSQRSTSHPNVNVIIAEIRTTAELENHSVRRYHRIIRRRQSPREGR